MKLPQILLDKYLSDLHHIDRHLADVVGNHPEVEAILDRARLVREDTLCQESLSDAERCWLRQTRPTEASHWNLLTDLKVQLLPYAG